MVTFSRTQPGQSVSCQIRQEEETPGRGALGGQAAFGKIFEMGVTLAAIGTGSQEPFEFQVTVSENDFPQETFPLEGWLSVPFPN